MESLPMTTQARQASGTLSAIEKEVQQLQRERERLLGRREAVKRETLQSLADAFARKLQAAGLSVKDGIEALRPYANLRFEQELQSPESPAQQVRQFRRAPASSVSSPPRVAAQRLAQDDSFEGYAQRVLGDDWQNWLEAPNLLLGGEAPRSVMTHKAGAAKVKALLAAYERQELS